MSRKAVVVTVQLVITENQWIVFRSLEVERRLLYFLDRTYFQQWIYVKILAERLTSKHRRDEAIM